MSGQHDAPAAREVWKEAVDRQQANFPTPVARPAAHVDGAYPRMGTGTEATSTACTISKGRERNVEKGDIEPACVSAVIP